MILVTTTHIEGYEVEEIIGLVRGSTVRCRHVGKDIMAVFKNMVGGEVEEYTKLLAESREQVIDRMTAEAKGKGANAILAVRFSSSEIASGAAELLVYGTAAKVRKLGKGGSKRDLSFRDESSGTV